MEDALEEEMATHFSVFATEQAYYLPQLYLLFFSLSLPPSLCTPSFLSLSFPLLSFFPFSFIFLLYLTLMEFTELRLK